VAAGLAEECEVQLAYAIGVAAPVSVHVDTHGTAKADEELLANLVREHFPLTPAGIIKHLKLKRPVYRQTARNGHFGRPGFSWEETDLAATLKRAATK
jgi:S-adenosylmethionine synthetase